MSDSNRDRIVSKIEKLLRKTAENGCTEGEVEAAMAAAHAMMTANNIELADVLSAANAQLSADDIIDELLRDISKFDRHEQLLLHVVCNICDVKSYMSKDIVLSPKNGRRVQRKRIHVYGLRQDVLAAKCLYNELLVVTKVLARAKLGPKWTQRHYYYCDGFALGLHRQSQALKAANKPEGKAGAMILVKDGLIEDYGSKLGLVAAKKSRSMDDKRASSPEFDRGHRDGKTYAIDAKTKLPAKGSDVNANNPRLEN